MNALPEQLAAVAQANAKAMQMLNRSVYAAATRLAALNAETARAALAGGIGDTLFAAKGAGNPGALPVPVQRGVEQAMRYWHAVYEIWADAQNELAEAVGSEVTALDRSMGGAMDGLGFAAAGGNLVLDAFNLAISAASASAEQISRASGLTGTAAGTATDRKVG